tara:strand:+ start:190 stop:375 length:186 start_codon:yes stop_codon:yes gene_type:complete
VPPLLTIKAEGATETRLMIACNVGKKLLPSNPYIVHLLAADFIKEKIFLKKIVKENNAITL